MPPWIPGDTEDDIGGTVSRNGTDRLGAEARLWPEVVRERSDHPASPPPSAE
jgi:hypothetical protein